MKREDMSEDDLMREVEKTKDRAMNAQAERTRYLGEFKERVIVALTKEQVAEDEIYIEVANAMKNREATKMIFSREVPLEKIERYIKKAEEAQIQHKSVDGLLYFGDVGLIIAADDALKAPIEDVFVKSIADKFSEKRLNQIYYQSFSKKICQFHLKVIKEEMQEYKDEYQEISFVDKLFGMKCPICEKLGGKNRG
ncbi:MAG: DUF1694 domain-containing protein [Leptotrichiaceae bacterium]|jgi:uncharacterized protein YueI